MHTYRRLAPAAATAYYPEQVAKAYNFPPGVTGAGYTVGVVELGGAFNQADLAAYFGARGLPVPSVKAVLVAGGTEVSDGPTGADGEVALDIQVIGSVAPGAAQRVYFAPNTEAGFAAAVDAAVTDRVTAISISWGAAETEWTAAGRAGMAGAVGRARAAGIPVLVASGDSGADDGTGSPVVDFPASCPDAVGCGGTRLTLAADGSRAAEVAWDDNPTSSASGGGVSQAYPGRQVPDVAGNADPVTGYRVQVDGGSYVFGGTSAVAPLMAALVALLSEALGAPLGSKADLMGTLLANPGLCFDVTSGSNGTYRAGPGRDDVTGLGVPDGGRLLAAITATAPTPPPPPPPSGRTVTFTDAEYATLDRWAHRRFVARKPAAAWLAATSGQ